MSEDLIRRSDVIDALKNALCELGGDEWGDGELGVHADDIDAVINGIPTTDRPQGYWTKTDVATYRCSECGKIQIADDVNELNYCCCCGSRNKMRR